MEALTITEICDSVKGKIIKDCEIEKINNVSIDSRKVNDGDLFIAIKGDKFDGHDFVLDLAKDKKYVAIVHRDDIKYDEAKNITIIKVNDTKEALKLLAAYYIKKMGVKVCGVTGSVGKTTTKDLIACVLSQKYNVLKTFGNFNNEIGLPLTIFKLEKHHEVAVLEMGMNNLGEIDALAHICKPSIGVITNVGVSHIENLKSRENILKAKMEITNYFNDKCNLIINGDNDLLNTIDKSKYSFKITTYGIDNKETDIFATNIEDNGYDGINFEINEAGNTYKAFINIPGVHNIYNALSAVLVGLSFDIDMETIIFGLKSFKGSDMRQEITKNEQLGIEIINDAYNASTNSMEASIKVLKKAEGKRKIAVLGDMLELGEFSVTEHEKVGGFVAENEIDMLITKGEKAISIANGAQKAGISKEKIISVSTNEDCIKMLKTVVKKGDVILIKGSRAMKMEEIVKFLKEYKGI